MLDWACGGDAWRVSALCYLPLGFPHFADCAALLLLVVCCLLWACALFYASWLSAFLCFALLAVPEYYLLAYAFWAYLVSLVQYGGGAWQVWADCYYEHTGAQLNIVRLYICKIVRRGA